MARVSPLLEPQRLPPVYVSINIGVDESLSNKIINGTVAEMVSTAEEIEETEETEEKEEDIFIKIRNESLFVIILLIITLGCIILLIGLILYLIFNGSIDGITFLDMFVPGLCGFAIGVMIYLFIKDGIKKNKHDDENDENDENDEDDD